LCLIHSAGIETSQLAKVPLGHGVIGRAARSAERYLRKKGAASEREALPAEVDLTACIPLVLGARVTGAIALFRLLPQKSEGFQDLDYELMELLATQAATALYASRHLASHEAQQRVH